MQTQVPITTTVQMQLTWISFVVLPILFFIVVYLLYRRRLASSVTEAQIDETWLSE